MSDTSHPPHRVHQTKKLRSACDACHQCKVKCPGGSPCSRCISKALPCQYGFQNRAGKPKGSKNKKTLERQRQIHEAWMAQLSPPIARDDMTPILDTDQSNLSSSCSAILDDADWFQNSALYSCPSSAVFSPDQNSMDEVVYGRPADSVISSHFSEPWGVDPDLSTKNSSAESVADCDAFVARFRIASGDDFSSDESDQLFALHADLELPTSEKMDQRSTTSCNCMQKQAANVASLDQIKSGNAHSHDRFDTIIRSVTTAIDSCIHFVDCSLCEKSFSSVILTLSVVNLIFLILKQSFDHNKTLEHGPLQPQISCFIGNYKTSTEEQQAIRNILLEMIFSKGRHALNALSGLVTTPAEPKESSTNETEPHEESSMKQGLHRLSTCDRDYVISYIARMKTITADVMNYIVATP